MSYYGSSIASSIGSSLQDSDQTITENENHVAENRAGEAFYDFVSLLSLFSGSTSYTDWDAVAMNLVHITPSNITLSERKRQGSSFSISLTDREAFSKILPHDMAHLNVPRLLAVKTPVLDPELRAQSNRRIFDSMAREYRILNYESLRNHENIVQLIGCCWRTISMDLDLTVPNLVLEDSELGDLEDFCQRHGNRITMRRRIGLCIDTALGVEALHLAGILHGDIKPRNILVFKHEERGFIAKIADFGSSISLYQCTFPRKACLGTSLFCAPELLGSPSNHSRDDLLKAEIYTLGFIFAFLVRGPHTLNKLRSASPGDIAKLKKQGELANWILQDEELLLLNRMIRPTFGEDAAERERQRGIWHWFQTQQYSSVQALQRKDKLASFDNTIDDGDWITLTNSRLKNEKSEMLLSDIVNRIMSVEPINRPIDVQSILQTLRHILTLELYAVYDPNYQCHKLYEEQLASSRRWLNPEGLHEGFLAMLNSQEIDTVILNYASNSSKSYSSGMCGKPNFFRAFRFIWRFGNIAEFPQKPPRSPSTRTRRLGVQQKQKRAQMYMAGNANKVKKYMKLVLENFRYLSTTYPSHHTLVDWHSRNHQGLREEKWIDKDEVFQATLDQRYTSLLPQSVRREFTRQLQYIADSPREAEHRRLTACFEYALMVLCYDDVSRTDVELVPRALRYLLRAATLGHRQAQSMVGRLFGVFSHVLPIERYKESDWLFQASLRGSLTAMERLRMLNPAAYREATHLIRFEYHGCFAKGELWEETEYLLVLISAGLADVPPNFIHTLVAHGQLKSLERLSHLPHKTFNSQNGLGETPLVAACRCGHANVVKLLFKLGADPSIGTFGNVHPLHFLSAFPEDDIPQICDLLLQHGAKLDVHSQEGSVYRQELDGRFGVEEGTPLLWSVWAGNFVAIRELLKYDTDIFSYKPVDVWEMLGDALINSSPLEAAVITYRYNIVNLLLSSCTNQEKLRQGLNNLRLVGRSVRATPLLMALERQILVQLRPTLIHGPLRHYAQLRTVETLLRFGSDPLRLSQEISGESVHAINLVCQDSNLLLLKFLWNYDEAKLRPSPRQYFECVLYAMQTSKRDIFDFLLSHRHDIPRVAEARSMELDLLGRACSLSPDSYYVSSVVNSIVQGLSLASSAATRKPDFTEQLFIALVAGNTGAARVLCQYGHCSFTGRFDNLSMLVVVIVLDTISPIVKDRVCDLLHLVSLFLPPEAKRKLFWKCAFDEGGGRHSQLTALRFAFRSQETAHGSTMIPAATNMRIIPNLLRAFNEPELLNSQVDPRSLNFPGDTALHMAARGGCLKEISNILDGQHGGSFKLDAMNNRNETLCGRVYSTP